MGGDTRDEHNEELQLAVQTYGNRGKNGHGVFRQCSPVSPCLQHGLHEHQSVPRVHLHALRNLSINARMIHEVKVGFYSHALPLGTTILIYISLRHQMGCRLKQGWVERPGTSEDGGRQQPVSQHGSSPRSTASFSNNQEAQYLRLPVSPQSCSCPSCNVAL